MFFKKLSLVFTLQYFSVKKSSFIIVQVYVLFKTQCAFLFNRSIMRPHMKKKCFIEFKLLVPSLLQISWVLLNCKSTYIINIFYVIIVLHFTNKYEYDEYEPATLHKKIKFFIKDFFRKFLQLTSTEEILNGKLHFLCSVKSGLSSRE